MLISNHVFTGLFTVELFVKIIANGFIIGQNTYMRNCWNIVDALLVIISFTEMLVTLFAANTSKILGVLKVFRLFRALRPLRVINRAPGLKLFVQTFISSLRPISNIMLICCVFFTIYGILGVQVLHILCQQCFYSIHKSLSFF